MERYTHGEIERKWQKKWAEDGVYAVEDSAGEKENFYQLFEFPYPSGNLHVGHWYAFAVPDIVVRFKKMQGYNVLYPIGFDAFGLPAENAAIKRGVNPRNWTYENMDHMRSQMRSMGAAFDWSREVVTCDPAYYKWTQWLFLQLFNAGLAEHRGVEANWCPSCKTVLANEQVVSGICERCDSTVEKRQMNQWQIGITKYADRLIDDLDTVDWPEEIKSSQKNWIGRSEGAEIEFNILDVGFSLKVFTTRPDTLYGVTYMVVAPEHEILQNLDDQILNIEEVKAYVAEATKKSEIDRLNDTKEKTGVKLEEITAINPANGEEIPVYVADYVLGGYGTGAIMAVPAHDERDHAFAQKYNIPIKFVVGPHYELDGENAVREDCETLHRRFSDMVIEGPDERWLLQKEGDHVHFVGGGVDDGETIDEAAARETIEETGYNDFEFVKLITDGVSSSGFRHTKQKNQVGVSATFHIKLKSFNQVASEIDAGKHSIEWVDKDSIEKLITWPHHAVQWESFCSKKIFSDHGRLINSGEFDGMESEEAKKAIVEKVGGRMTKTYKLRDWTVSRQRYWGAPIPIIHCDECGPVAVPDADLPVELPDVEDYLPNDEGRSPLSKVEGFVNAVCPECGKDAKRETDTFDTFMCSSWYFLRYADPQNIEAFADMQRLQDWMAVDHYSGGAEHTTMHLLYSRFFTKALYDLDLVPVAEPYTRRMNRSLIMGPDGNKMSKSKGNVIDPDDIVEKLGADTMRLYLAFIGPYNEVSSYPWNPQSIIGVRRFIERVWKLQQKIQGEASVSDEIAAEANRALHTALETVTASIEGYKLNTGVAALMSALNVLEKLPALEKGHLKLFIMMLSPYAPHITQEVWENLGEQSMLVDVEWPEVDQSLLVEDEIELVVQINGKVRAKMTTAAGQSDEALEAIAKADEKVQGHIGEKEIRKVIVIKGRLVNIVV